MQNSRSFYGRFLLPFILMVSLLTFLSLAQAQTEVSEKTESTALPAPINPEEESVLKIQNFDDINDFVARLKEKYPYGKATINLLHIEGRDQDPEVVALSSKLKQEGFKVQLTILTEKDFDQKIEENAHDLYDLEVGVAPRSLPDSLPSTKALFIQAAKNAVKSLVSYPKGITLAGHFYKSFSKGKLIKIHNDQKETNEQIEAALSIAGNGTLIFDSVFLYKHLITPHSSFDYNSTAFLMADISLYAWVFTCVRYGREITSYKNQKDYAFSIGTTTFQEFLLNIPMAYTIGYASNPNFDRYYAIHHVGDIAYRSVLGGFALAAVDNMRARLTQKQDYYRDLGTRLMGNVIDSLQLKGTDDKEDPHYKSDQNERRRFIDDHLNDYQDRIDYLKKYFSFRKKFKMSFNPESLSKADRIQYDRASEALKLSARYSFKKKQVERWFYNVIFPFVNNFDLFAAVNNDHDFTHRLALLITGTAGAAYEAWVYRREIRYYATAWLMDHFGYDPNDSSGLFPALKNRFCSVFLGGS